MSKKELKGQRFDNQHDDEELLMLFRKHPIVMRRGLIAVLVFLCLGLIPVIIKPNEVQLLWFGLVGMGIGGIFLFFDWIAWYFSVYYVSDQRVIQVTQKGLFTRSVVDIGLDKIQNINFKIPGLQADMFKFGTIVIQTYAGDLVLDFIHHPQRIQESMIKIIKELDLGSSFKDTAMNATHDND